MKEAKAPPKQAAKPTMEKADFKPGDRVQVWWESQYWDAKVLRAQGGLYRITYIGWGSEWNEWVDRSRIRK